MNGKNGKQSDYPEIALVPYPVIVAASKGDPDAMKIVTSTMALTRTYGNGCKQD